MGGTRERNLNDFKVQCNQACLSSRPLTSIPWTFSGFPLLMLADKQTIVRTRDEHWN